jgi:hypothetical protein
LVTQQYQMLTRVLAANGALEEQKQLFDETYRAGRRRVNKSLQTLTLFVDRRDWRQSALKQLSEDLGGADTLVVLMELREAEQTLGIDLDRAITDLQSRLDGLAGGGSTNPLL